MCRDPEAEVVQSAFGICQKPRPNTRYVFFVADEPGFTGGVVVVGFAAGGTEGLPDAAGFAAGGVAGFGVTVGLTPRAETHNRARATVRPCGPSPTASTAVPSAVRVPAQLPSGRRVIATWVPEGRS